MPSPHGPWPIIRRVLASRSLRRVLPAYLLFNAAEYGTWVAMLLYAHERTGPASVGLVALAGQWWVDAREDTPMDKPQVAAHLVNLAWNGMRNLRQDPALRTSDHGDDWSDGSRSSGPPSGATPSPARARGREGRQGGGGAAAAE